jgi:hypothetical protein
LGNWGKTKFGYSLSCPKPKILLQTGRKTEVLDILNTTPSIELPNYWQLF